MNGIPKLAMQVPWHSEEISVVDGRNWTIAASQKALIKNIIN